MEEQEKVEVVEETTELEVQKNFNEDGIDVLLEDGVIENEDAEEPEGIGAGENFTMRTGKPGAGNKFFITQSRGGYSTCIQGYPTDANCNVLANCVGYACGRFNEIIGTMKYPSLNCNAENFIERAKNTYGLEISPVPTLGGIMVWQKGDTLNGGDGAGHVAIVEKIIDSNTIYTSESGYGSSAFWNSTRSNSNGRWGLGSGYKFRGCIVNPAIGKVTAPTNPTTTRKYAKGNKVRFTGTLYGNSYGGNPGQSRSNLLATIYLVNSDSNASCPYNINNGLGWVKESDLTPIVDYSKGNYKTLVDMNVRTGAGTNNSIKKVSQLTVDGKKNATSSNPNANAVYKTGTVFTALEIISVGSAIWAKTPSGYICIKGESGKVYCSKI